MQIKAAHMRDELLTARLGAARERAEKMPENLTRVGTLAEKLLHRTLKFYIEPNEEKHEVSLLGSVADVVNDDGIFEIQTRSFEKLRRKLPLFTMAHRVTLVHPLVANSHVCYIDKESGELVERRMSPRRE